MQTFLQNFSVTKLVFLLVMICLCVFTGYQYWIWQEITIKLRETVVTAIVSFYFWQKVWESKKDNFIIFVFWLWAVYTNITNRLKDLEHRVTKIEDLDLDSRLTKMQVDLDWIKSFLNNSKKK